MQLVCPCFMKNCGLKIVLLGLIIGEHMQKPLGGP